MPDIVPITGPSCGHDACAQHYQDTGEYLCLETQRRVATLIGSHPESISPELALVVTEVISMQQAGVSLTRPEHLLAQRLIARTKSLRDARARADKWEEHAELLCKERDLARNQAAYYQAKIDQKTNKNDLKSRQLQRRKVLKECWGKELKQLKPGRIHPCPTAIARALKLSWVPAGAEGMAIYIEPGDREARIATADGHYETPAGKHIHHPVQYRRAGGVCKYVSGGYCIRVGRRWLRDHLGGIAKRWVEDVEVTK
jgi:hypothetical protein